jgi:hypothetical protein
MTLESVTSYEVQKPVSFVALLFGAATAPVFWLGQLMLSYGVTAQACYPGDHPEAIASASSLKIAMMGFDCVAVLAAAAGGIVAWLCLVRIQRERRGSYSHSVATGMGRARFLALWGVFSSQWFLGAILFNVIASLTVPPCVV